MAWWLEQFGLLDLILRCLVVWCGVWVVVIIVFAG